MRCTRFNAHGMVARWATLFCCVAVLLFATKSSAQSLSESEILGGAEARIQKYRTGEAALQLIGPSGKPLAAHRRIRIEQTRHKFLFGANIFLLGQARTAAENATYAERFAALLNYATVPFYWWDYESVEGKPNWSATENIVQWAKAHNVTLKGHPLAYNYFDPKWLPKDPAEAVHLQVERITREVSHFKGEIDIWDVVNEATHYDRPECKIQAPIMTDAIAKSGMPAYIQSAFKTARAANPAATLLINDYDVTDSYAENVISKLVDENGRPLYDVIGVQSHQNIEVWPVEKIWSVCERFAKFGKPLHFTETLLLSGKLGYYLKEKDPGFDWASTPEGEKQQAEEVTRFYTVVFSHPAVEAITWWDLSDQNGWMGAPLGLLRDDMTPKPAYDALMKLIKGKWWTRTEAVSSREGRAQFHGFYGDYRAQVEDHGRILTGTFSFDKTTHGPIEVRLQ